eukprot:TRINITY_DN73_c10_g1_i1.p1 TRINITY_DN73_c10_g1~~TRINITY_DN73_c10_g1_i1.p1  ORF type:complete len:596 (-),score=95.21 TRINITY_DN73_c10_g1_i1:57-1760(-)
MPKFSTMFFYLFVLYMAFSLAQVGFLWFPTECNETESNSKCYRPKFDYDLEYDLRLYTLDGMKRGQTPFFVKELVNLDEEFTEHIQVPLHSTTRLNGTMSMVALLVEHGEAINVRQEDILAMTSAVPLTRYQPVRFHAAQYLLQSATESSSEDLTKEVVAETAEELQKKELDRQRLERRELARKGEVMTHWVPKVNLRLVVDQRSYPSSGPPRDVAWRVVANRRYLPIFYVDDLHVLRDHLSPLSRNVSRADPYITFKYTPTSIGTHRVLQQLHTVIKAMKALGMSDNETEQALKIIAPDRIYRLAVTMVVSVLHSLFSFLAFKNEIGFWKGRENVRGLSQRAVIGGAICNLIIFLFLYDAPGTSWLILGTAGTSVILDFWKCTKVLKLKLSWSGLSQGEKSNEEKETNQFDAKGMYYLSLILYPLVIGWALYSLYTRAHRSWWSWFIGSAANGVYAFGFLMMTPQILINYKMKSVAHLPWRALTYKVFNTFVDDIFAWVIDMPTIHRLATLRDDLVFFVYLYQRWIYRVDKSRPNEYGFVYEDEEAKGTAIDDGEADSQPDKIKAD